MKNIKKQLIAEAKKEHGNIFPCGEKTNLSDCFTYESGKIYFWFNILSDKSTRILTYKLKGE